jgi:signal transduction histidine kinase
VKRPRFRARLFVILLCFAAVPSAVLTLLWAGTLSRALPLVSGSAAWERAAMTGERAIAAARTAPLTPAQRRAFDAHEQELRASLELARRFGFVAPRVLKLVAFAAVGGLVVLTVVALRVAGHLSRQLSRPLDQLVGWTALIQSGQPLPDGPEPRGAPEFGTLRSRMRTMARELALGRQRALEAERAQAFRETAQRIAHELKNPLTPIRFAIARLRADAPATMHDAIDVLATETERLAAMARSFAQFGRLPDGPFADVDLGELARAVVRTTLPPTVAASVEVEESVPMVRGHHDALSRALANVLLNAAEACPPEVASTGAVTVRVAAARHPVTGEPAVELRVRDRGCGIPPAVLARIWEPYVTHNKPGGTGLGLAIARQTIAAHGGVADAVSAIGRGTEIRFVLPVAGPTAIVPPSSKEAPCSTAGTTSPSST